MATVLSTPPRNSRINGGPFNAYARSPQLGVLLLQVSDFVRFNTSLPPRLSEFAIMITARQWSQLYEWRSHYPLAIKGGLDRQIEHHIFPRLPPDLEITVFRIVQEALTNIYRHSESEDARIELSRDADRVVIRVRDFGKGISATGHASGVGISGMNPEPWWKRPFQSSMPLHEVEVWLISS